MSALERGGRKTRQDYKISADTQISELQCESDHTKRVQLVSSHIKLKLDEKHDGVDVELETLEEDANNFLWSDID